MRRFELWSVEHTPGEPASAGFSLIDHLLAAARNHSEGYGEIRPSPGSGERGWFAFDRPKRARRSGAARDLENRTAPAGHFQLPLLQRAMTGASPKSERNRGSKFLF